jgi:hypothetical protein
MKKEQITDNQIMAALKQINSEIAGPNICRELGICSDVLQMARQVRRYRHHHDGQEERAGG